MQLILHIGTHKTGTSSLQECLKRNESLLATIGIYYAHMPRSRNFNALGRLVAKKYRAEALVSLNQQVEKAKVLGSHTMVISAESFYAMTIFFSKFNQKEYEDYWASESEAIHRLSDLLSAVDSTRIVLFLRRQDHFLESIYRQVVKSARAVTMPIEEFKEFMGEALDYWRHVELWTRVFPDCVVYNYEEASQSISEFFLRQVLHLDESDEFNGLTVRLNNRLNREVLEYKKLLNGKAMSRLERSLCSFACVRLASALPHDDRYQDLLPPSTRKALIDEMQSGNNMLQAKFGMKPFSALETANGWSPYPGLSPDRADELEERYLRIQRSMEFRLERVGLFARDLIKRRMPAFGWIVPLGRGLLPRHRRAR